MLYHLGFWAILVGLGGIFLMRSPLKRVSWLTLPGLVLWLIGLASFATSWQQGFGQAFVDLLWLGGAIIGLRLIGGWNTQKWPLGLLLAAVLGLGHTAMMTTLSPAPSPKSEAAPAPLNLDQEGELLVELKNGVSVNKLAAWAEKEGLSISLAFQPADEDATELDDYYLIDIPANSSLSYTEWSKRITESGLADWVEPNEVIKLDVLPARPLPGLNQKLGVDDPSVGEQWSMVTLEIDKLYGLLQSGDIKPKKRALVAILDTGVDAQHEDLKDNYFSIKKKYNDDPQGHGTHCAGIAGAVTNNGVGVASYARTSDYFRITSIKVLSASGSGTQQSIIGGIIEAADRNADVISLSLGGFSNQSRQRAYTQAVKYATDKGAIVVAAAGNSNRDAAGYTPVNANGIIGVSAIDNNLQRAQFSNRVNKIKMAVAAPGVSIYSTKPNNNYAAHNGTSMATPQVSGLLGLMKSIRPNLTAKEAYQILNDTGKTTKNPAETGQLIQPYQAVARLVGELQ